MRSPSVSSFPQAFLTFCLPHKTSGKRNVHEAVLGKHCPKSCSNTHSAACAHPGVRSGGSVNPNARPSLYSWNASSCSISRTHQPHRSSWNLILRTVFVLDSHLSRNASTGTHICGKWGAHRWSQAPSMASGLQHTLPLLGGRGPLWSFTWFPRRCIHLKLFFHQMPPK